MFGQITNMKIVNMPILRCADRMSTDKMSNRQNVEQTKCRTDNMSNRQNVDRRNAEQTKCRQIKYM